jgi:putative oxidoreductase
MKILKTYQGALALLNSLAPLLALLGLRLILAWEFGEAGIEKLNGTNWFADISFPFPFSLLPANVNWSIAMWFEILGATALIIGFATRFFASALFVITIVAIFSVHWPESWDTLSDLAKGYRIIDEEGDGFGNFKLPVIYLTMILPIIFYGAGKISLDHWIKKMIETK